MGRVATAVIVGRVAIVIVETEGIVESAVRAPRETARQGIARWETVGRVGTRVPLLRRLSPPPLRLRLRLKLPRPLKRPRQWKTSRFQPLRWLPPLRPHPL